MTARIPERCMCGATDCPSCGPAQGYRYPPLSDAEEAQIEARAQELFDERMQSRESFDDLLAGMETDTINHQLHRALMSLDNACAGDRIALDAIRAALSQIQAVVVAEAEKVWREECRDQAERELHCGGNRG